MVNSALKKYIFFFLLISLSLQGELKLLCIGDSITEGGKINGTYRRSLHDLLKKNSVKVEYVGRRVTTYKGQTLLHEGYSGKNIHFLVKAIAALPDKNVVDVALIHAGHNNFAKDEPVPGVVKSTKALIELLKKANPRIKIFLACVIESGKLPKYSYIPELNKELKDLAQKDSQVVLVDMNEKFRWQEHATQDKVHPNKQGAEVMAKMWFAALKKAGFIVPVR